MNWRVDGILSESGSRALCLCSFATGMERETHIAKLFLSPHRDSEFQYFEREAVISATLECKGIVPLEAYNLDGPRPILVYPRLETLTLHQWLADTSHSLAKPTCLWILRQILESLESLHRHGYMHGNVRPEHILLDAYDQVTLVGLGGCESVGEWTSLPRFMSRYDAPETGELEFEASSAQDIYAVSQLMIELLGESMRESALVQAIRSPNPSERPTASEIVHLLIALEAEMFGSHIQFVDKVDSALVVEASSNCHPERRAA